MTSKIAGLYAITDPELLPGERLLAGVRAAIAGGARLIQYRDKPATAGERLQRARALAALCRAQDVVFLVNDDVELALASGADGVHLGQRDGAVRAARNRLSTSAIIGQTCHASLELAQAAERAGADYVAFGRFFPSQTKPQALPADPALLPAARRLLRIPIVAIGGVTVDNAPALLAAGADAIAVINGLFAAADITQRARAFATLCHRDQTP